MIKQKYLLKSVGFPSEILLVVSPDGLLGVPPRASQDFPGVPSKADLEVPTEGFLL